MVTSVIPASLRVSWNPPLGIDHNGNITGYVIQYTRNGSSDMMGVNVTNGTTHTISGLFVVTEYSIRVAAVNFNGTGLLSNATTRRSGEDGMLISHSYALRINQKFIAILSCFLYSI